MKKSSRTILIVGLSAAVVVSGAVAYQLLHRRPTSASAAPAAEQRIPVVLAQVREVTFEERVDVSGNVEAKSTALVSARVPGVLDEILVDKGDAVEQGQKLFQTDKIRLTRAVESAEQQVAVAAAAVRARQATVERIEADLTKVQADFDRYKRLYEQDHAVTRSAFEAQESHLKQVQAGLREAKAGLELARAQEEQAKSNLAIAQKDLADSLVTSPISGRISQRMMEPGEMAGAGTPVLRVDDLRLVEFVAYLPEAYYSRVVEGSTVLHAKVQGRDVGPVVITTKSPTIHAKLRTFEIRALLRDPPAGVVPGARADLSVILQKRTGLGVPRTAVLRRGPGLVVFAVQDGRARMMAIQTGLETDGWVEVRGDGMTKEVRIVRMGQDRLNDGTAVVEATEEVE